MATTRAARAEPVDMKLEVVVLGVSDVDRAKAFYETLGWRLDADFATGDDFRVLQLTPHNSEALTTRLPGGEWKLAEHHHHYEKTHALHHWWDRYAPYLSARQNGSSPEEAAAADRYMEEVRR